MFKNAIDAAVAACLSMLLEVSGDPKAGNVDREHDYADLKFEHFLASATGAFPAFIEAAKSRKIGKCILMAVEESSRWHKAGNVHFGAFLLLIPLLTAWDEEGMRKMGRKATENLRKTSYWDSLNLLKAFRMSSARVVNAKNLDLRDTKTEKMLLDSKINIYDWMAMAPEENLIAKELVSGYSVSIEGAEFILKSEKPAKETIVDLYYHLLSTHPDPLVIAKKGREYANKLMELAGKAKSFEARKKLDERLLMDGANPGTIADLTASSLYLALAEGWRF